MLVDIRDRRERRLIVTRIERLMQDPEAQGKALTGEFRGCRSVRAGGQRYRIVYRVSASKRQVAVIAVGRRREGDKRDVYTRLARVLGRR